MNIHFSHCVSCCKLIDTFKPVCNFSKYRSLDLIAKMTSSQTTSGVQVVSVNLLIVIDVSYLRKVLFFLYSGFIRF